MARFKSMLLSVLCLLLLAHPSFAGKLLQSGQAAGMTVPTTVKFNLSDLYRPGSSDGGSGIVVTFAENSCTATGDSEYTLTFNYYAPWDTDTVHLSLFPTRNGLGSTHWWECDEDAVIVMAAGERLKLHGTTVNAQGLNISAPVPAVGPMSITLMASCAEFSGHNCEGISTHTAWVYVEGTLPAGYDGLK